MKPIYKLSIVSGIVLLMFVASGCNDLLKEQPRAVLTPTYYGNRGRINFRTHFRYIIHSGIITVQREE